MRSDTPPAHQLPPLAEGNRLQRAYARWAGPRYAQMPAEAREAAELMDRFLYSRRGLGVWLGMAGSVTGTAVGLRHAGLDNLLALGLAVLLWAVLPMMLLSAWLVPSQFSGARLRRHLPQTLLLALAGGATGYLLMRWRVQGGADLPALARDLGAHAGALVPAVAVGTITVVFMLWGVAGVRRQMLERQLAQSRLTQERDLAARQLAEARLRLLQAQIQPHFIFNTLAAVQHWVDTADPRAAPLLRALTTFLRGSTELLARETATLAEEAALAGHYLAILQARLGPRLQVAIDIAPAVAGQALPPGLLLTLVENAVEHGISPALSGGTVRVQADATADGWRLCVSDDGTGLAAGWQEGTGLANCRQRLAHHFGASARLTLSTGQPGTLACIAVAIQAPVAALESP